MANLCAGCNYSPIKSSPEKETIFMRCERGSKECPRKFPEFKLVRIKEKGKEE